MGVIPDLRVAEVWFGFPGSQAIPLREVHEHRFVGDDPEWNANGRERPAAYLCGARPTIRVAFTSSMEGRFDLRLKAFGPRVDGPRAGAPGVAARQVTLTFDQTKRSERVEFEFDGPFTEHNGERWLPLEWCIETDTGGLIPVETTNHQILTTLRQPVNPRVWVAEREVPKDAPRADVWTYEDIATWSSRWADGCTGDKDICDAIMAGLRDSGLRYGEQAWSVRALLRREGGMCAAWARLFQALVGFQGVTVERRMLMVDWRKKGREVFWAALVVDAPHIRNEHGTPRRRTYFDVDRSPMRSAPVNPNEANRYVFHGNPHGTDDGHCLIFLKHGGGWYLYDPSFGHGGIRLDWDALPDPDLRQSVKVDPNGSFRKAYLDVAVQYLMGSVDHNDHGFLQAQIPGVNVAGSRSFRAGLTMKTSALDWERDHDLTFRWGLW